MFPAGVFGYLIATATTHRIQENRGRCGIALVSSAFRLIFALVLSSTPAFPVFLVSFAGLGYGTGLTDTAWNTWASSTSQPNVIQGILHGSFSVGCVMGPALATIVLRRSAWPLLYGLLVGYLHVCRISELVTDPFNSHLLYAWNSWYRPGLSATTKALQRAPKVPTVIGLRFGAYYITTACGFVAHTIWYIKASRVGCSHTHMVVYTFADDP